MKNNKFEDRRGFIKKASKSVGLLTLSILPVSFSACSNEEQVDLKSMIKIGKLNKLDKGPYPKKVEYEGKVKNGVFTQERKGFVYIIRDAESDELLIMSPLCTHLECTTTITDQDLTEQGITFYCPCHNGAFNDQGVNIGGPPQRPLDLFNSYIIDGNIYVEILKPIKR